MAAGKILLSREAGYQLEVGEPGLLRFVFDDSRQVGLMDTLVELRGLAIFEIAGEGFHVAIGEGDNRLLAMPISHDAPGTRPTARRSIALVELFQQIGFTLGVAGDIDQENGAGGITDGG